MTDLAIVESRADRASVHICDQLRGLLEWTIREDSDRADGDGGGTYYRTDGIELRTFEELHLELEYPAEAFDCDPELLVFASRHSGETGALLTAHHTGNFGPAEFGGEDYALAEAAPNALARLLAAFEAYAPDGYDVGLECTHHGPTDVGCPSLFAELGSDDEQWDDPAGAEAVARAILELRDVSPDRERTVVGFGGNHYAPRFERIVRDTSWSVGHVAADWALEAMGHPDPHRDVLERAFDASGADVAVIDGEWPVLEETLAEMEYRVVSETWLRETDDRPLELVEVVESALGPIADGTRFGDRADGSITVRDLPNALLETAQGVDPDRVRKIITTDTVAFETTNGGSRVGTRAAFPEDDLEASRRSIVDSLATVLEESYDSVTVAEGVVVAEETAFDPALARDAGVPDGPKFGTLADGDPVTVDGETIDPDRVHTRRTHRFPI
ncbi:hypothetical protein D8Y22_00525 [Salinadaptatus halalkaliphilus]|uniref:D-aminoacyl-tRNA deacylase n=1 Tax=Salinadaptatus halalkaliphilus TaxID=2419781 RepID=A0A4S3TTA0_9EURY|nr:D-aminoacyl-tRNA deacylase [Salinadaptatus halalkaliphilus]THE66653.1 hypothetical protein D8Y22_00525 [Salinadaptatus halalkaliphilus]